jgi:hypothetical protein
MSIVGKSGCGKTQMLASILDGVSERIKTVIIATAAQAPLHDAIIHWFMKRGCGAGKITDPEELMEYCRLANQYREVSLEHPGLIIFDDFNRGSQSIHCPYWKAAVHCFTKLRNEGWNFIIVAQQPSFIPTVIRNCTTARVLFDCATRSAIQTFIRDVSDRVPRDVTTALVEYIRKVSFSYFIVQEHPFTVSAGSSNVVKPIFSEDSVIIPNFRGILQEMGVSSAAELAKKAREAQLQAGNTAEEL